MVGYIGLIRRLELAVLLRARSARNINGPSTELYVSVVTA